MEQSQSIETPSYVIGDSIEPDESRTPEEFATDESLTFEQVAKTLGCSTIQVRNWVHSGMLTAEAAGSIERIRRSELSRVGDPDERAAQAFERERGTS